MLPYWCATVVVVALDAVILERILPSTDLALTLIGINVSDPTRHLDYARWFVTFILLWYVLFYLAMLLKDKAGLDPLILLFSCGLVFFLFDHYVYSFAYQEFAFPVGCALARYRDEIRSRFERARGRWVVSAVALLAGGVLYKALMPVLYPALWPMLFFRFSFQVTSIAIAAGFIIILGRFGALGQFSRTLALLGVLSYELFLLHGPLLIKYNPVFGLMPVALLPLSFMLLLGILLILSAGIHRVLAAFGRPR
jgi:peptidoglycan/LPS O-acetylase OafA/YrhL